MRNVMFAMVLLVSVTMLAGAQCQPKEILTDLANCEKSAAAKDAPGLVPIVTNILQAGVSDPAVDAALKGLGKEFGMDTLDCAMAAAVAGLKQLFSTSQPTSQAASQPVRLRSVGVSFDQNAIMRGQRWLSTRGKPTRTVGQ